MAKKYYSGPASDHFDGERFFVEGGDELNTVAYLLKWKLGRDPRAPWPKHIPSSFTDTPPPRVAERNLRVTLVGHASFLYQVAGLNILVDPVYSERVSPFSFAGPRRVNAPGVAFDALPAIDVVLVSHGHYDHLDFKTLARLRKKFNPRFICALGNDVIIGGAEAFDWGQSVDVGQGVEIHFVPSFHWSARSLGDRKKQLWCSFVITTPAGTLYHIADTGYGDGRFSREVARDFGPIRLAAIPIGAYEPRWFMKGQHVNPTEAVRIFLDCGAARAIGHHWGTFQLTNEAHDQPEKELAAALAAASIPADRFRAFRPGEVWQSA